MRWMTRRAISVLLASSKDAICLKKRGFKMRWMTWRAISGRPEIWALEHPSVGYRQGMHELASLLLGRGLHSSTFRLNVSAFYGIGSAFRGCFTGGVQGVSGGLRGCPRCVLCQKRLRLS